VVEKVPSGMGKINTVGVLRLRAKSAIARDKSVRRSAQDDDFLEGIEKHLVKSKKHGKIEKVTSSQDDDFVGVL
jgi:hypothetical protein